MNPVASWRKQAFEPGDPVPWFVQRSTSNAAYHFDTVAGRYVVLCFFLQAGDARGKGMLKIVDEVSFPEYGPRSYKAPPGSAAPFSYFIDK